LWYTVARQPQLIKVTLPSSGAELRVSSSLLSLLPACRLPPLPCPAIKSPALFTTPFSSAQHPPVVSEQQSWCGIEFRWDLGAERRGEERGRGGEGVW